MKHKNYFVYIMANERNGTIYTGVTGDLTKRVFEHKEGKIEGFTKEYNLKCLVYFETTENIESAISRETQLKGWKRAWKIELIEKENPDWNDLSGKFLHLDSGSSPE